jgi:hypothetical protein
MPFEFQIPRTKKHMGLSLCEGNMKLSLYLITYQAMHALGDLKQNRRHFFILELEDCEWLASSLVRFLLDRQLLGWC